MDSALRAHGFNPEASRTAVIDSLIKWDRLCKIYADSIGYYHRKYMYYSDKILSLPNPKLK